MVTPPLAATPRAEQWLRNKLNAAMTPLRVYRANSQSHERHVRYSWTGSSDVHYLNGVRFVATTFLIYVSQPVNSTNSAVYSMGLEEDADKLNAALDFADVDTQGGRRISACIRDNEHYFEVWDSDPVQLVEVQLGAYFRVYSSVEGI